MTRWQAQLLLLIMGLSVLGIFLYNNWDAIDAEWEPPDHRKKRKSPIVVDEVFSFHEDASRPLLVAEVRASNSPVLWILPNLTLIRKTDVTTPGLGYRRSMISRTRLHALTADILRLSRGKEGAISLELRGERASTRYTCSIQELEVLIQGHTESLATRHADLEGVVIQAEVDSSAENPDEVPAWPTRRIKLSDCIGARPVVYQQPRTASRLDQRALCDGLYQASGVRYRVRIRPLLPN